MSPTSNPTNPTTVTTPSPNRSALIQQHLAHFESLAASTSTAFTLSAPAEAVMPQAQPLQRSSSPFSRFNGSTMFTGDGRASLKERWSRIRSSYRQQQQQSPSSSTSTSPIERPGTPIPATPILAPTPVLTPLSLTSLPSPLSLSPSPSPSPSSPITIPGSRNSRIPIPVPTTIMSIPRTPRTPPMEPIQEIATPAAPAAPHPRRTLAGRGRGRASMAREVAVLGSGAGVGVGVDADRLASPLPPLPLLRLRRQQQRGRRDSADAFDPDVVGVVGDEDEGESEGKDDLVSLLDEATAEWGWSPADTAADTPSPSPSPAPRSFRAPTRRSHRPGYPSPLVVAAATGIDAVPSLIEMVDRAADEWTPSI